jgi:hypothetical protein
MQQTLQEVYLVIIRFGKPHMCLALMLGVVPSVYLGKVGLGAVHCAHYLSCRVSSICNSRIIGATDTALYVCRHTFKCVQKCAPKIGTVCGSMCPRTPEKRTKRGSSTSESMSTEAQTKHLLLHIGIKGGFSGMGRREMIKRLTFMCTYSMSRVAKIYIYICIRIIHIYVYICTVCTQFVLYELHQACGHLRRMYTILANPKYVSTTVYPRRPIDSCELLQAQLCVCKGKCSNAIWPLWPLWPWSL